MTIRITEEFYGLAEEKLHKVGDLVEVPDERGKFLIGQRLAEEEVIPLAPTKPARKTAKK